MGVSPQIFNNSVDCLKKLQKENAICSQIVLPMLTNRYLHLLVVSFTALVLHAQTNARTAYVLEYSQIAVDEMNRSGIPASITLAQGILESGNGLRNWPRSQTTTLESNATAAGRARRSTTTTMLKASVSGL